MSPKRKIGDPEILHVNFKVDPPDVSELYVSPQMYIEVANMKKGYNQARYKFDCMAGIEHPLSIERERYVLTTVHTSSLDASLDRLMPDQKRPGQFSEPEIEFINSIQRRPEVEWAVDNSFDGVYVQKYEDFSRFATSFKFAVYLKEEQATFWKLKFHGR